MNTTNVLIIEDDPDGRASLTDAVAGMGHSAAAAGNAADGLRAFREGRFDCVLSDLVLPDRDGISVLEEIGIHHEGRSKSADEFRDADFDLVVTVCDSAAEECPAWLGRGKKVHHSFPDPAKTGDIADFRSVRDAIALEIPQILKKYE
jgi:arsenate reductase